MLGDRPAQLEYFAVMVPIGLFRDARIILEYDELLYASRHRIGSGGASLENAAGGVERA